MPLIEADAATEVAQKVVDAGGQAVSVRAYGAKLNGSTDDSEALTDAIAAAVASGTKTVLVPWGTCKVDSAVTVPSGILLMIGRRAKVQPASGVAVTVASGAMVMAWDDKVYTLDTSLGGTFTIDGTEWFMGPSGLAGKVVDRGGQVYNVLAYGAKGDGVTDDTAALQALLDDVVADGGGIIYFPPGTYNTTGLILDRVANQSVVIQGAGKGVSIIEMTATSGTCFRVEPDNSVVRDIRFTGPGNAGDTADGLLLDDADGSGPKHTSVENVYITGFGGVGMIDDGFGNDYRSLQVYNCGNGYENRGSGGHIQWSGGFISGCTTNCVVFTGGLTQISFIGVNMESTPTGIFGGASSAAPRILILIECHFEGNTVQDVRLGSGTDEVIADGCRFGASGDRTSPVFQHVGGASNGHRLHFRACTWLDEPASGGSTTLLSLGTDVSAFFAGHPLVTGKFNPATNVSYGLRAQLFYPEGKAQDLGNVTGNVAIDFSKGDVVSMTLTGNVTLQDPTGVVQGHRHSIRFIQDGTGSHTVSFSAKWSKALTLASAANAVTRTDWIGLNNSDRLEQSSNMQPA